jgi:hypothetical protein
MLMSFARSPKGLSRSFGLPFILAFAALHFASPAQAQLTIVPTFDSTITGDSNAAAIEGTINAAILEYRNFFSNNITVNITFGEGGGLGSSSSAILSIPYTTYRAALVSHATTPNDAIANLSLPVQTNSPADGQSQIYLTTANARALGLIGAGGNDGNVTLNTSIMNFTRPPGNPGKYDLKAVAEHEIDEVLGFGSGLNIPIATPRQSRPQDLFRYSASGVRSYDTAAASSYFSIDGGNTVLLAFNQSGGGADYGDWASSATPHVQDAFGTPGATPNLNTELTNLDVIGYSFVNPVPEPGTLGLLTAAGVAVGGVIRRRRTAAAA